jgi:hypothetical protein
MKALKHVPVIEEKLKKQTEKEIVCNQVYRRQTS